MGIYLKDLSVCVDILIYEMWKYLVFNFFLQHVQWIFSDISAVSVCDGKSYFFNDVFKIPPFVPDSVTMS